MSEIKALINPVTPFQQNASIIYCSSTKKCAFVDPGGDIESLLSMAQENDLIPEKILLTHGHIDHAGGATELAEILKLEIHDEWLLPATGRVVDQQGQTDWPSCSTCSRTGSVEGVKTAPIIVETSITYRHAPNIC